MNKKAGFTLMGFTLIELLVVISIIGVIMAFSFVGFSQARKSARDTKRKADLEQIRSALEIYRNDIKAYPATGNLGALSPNYIATLPTDPTTGQIYGYSLVSPNSYALCAYLESGGTNNLCGSIDCGPNPGYCNYITTQP